MSNNGSTQFSFDPVVQPLVDFWSSYVKHADDVTRQVFEGLDDGSAFKNWQRRWMEAISKSMDAYMRTPAFLEAMKNNTNAVVKMKSQADDLAKEMARNINLPTTGDISGLFERLHSVEEVILRRLTKIDERLQAVEKQVSATAEVK